MIFQFRLFQSLIQLKLFIERTVCDTHNRDKMKENQCQKKSCIIKLKHDTCKRLQEAAERRIFISNNLLVIETCIKENHQETLKNKVVRLFH